MQAHHAMADFRCRSTCTHKECQRHAHLGVVDEHEQCKCLGEVNASSIFLENVLDLANTLAQIMIICGIHECKAKSTVDVTTYAFLHYDQVCYCIDTTPKKRIRKEDLFHELGKRCLMNRVEAHLAYTIIKRGFKAFYYKPSDDQLANDGRPTFSEECVYVHAARKTAESYARYDGLSCEEERGFEAKIKVAYKKFYDRMQTRRTQPEGEDCNCCFCAKKRGHLIYGKQPPRDTPKKKEAHRCPYCCQKKKKRFIHPGRAGAKCPKCHRAMRYCICPKYEFNLDWVKSIWVRPDMDLYYKETIEERPLAKSGCEPEEPDPEIKGCDSQEVIKEEVEEEEGERGNASPGEVPTAAPKDIDMVEEEGDDEACHPYEPFKCPGDGNCISIQYLCDGAPDCSDGYDEDLRLCTAAKRPPVEETASFLQSLIASHGPNYLEKLFGSKARDALAPLGGVEKVAIALSESQTIEDFGAALHLMRSDLEHLRSVFMAVENGDLGMLKSLGIKDSELGDVKFFLEKLVNTGFLD